MIRQPPRATRTDTRIPCTTLCRSVVVAAEVEWQAAQELEAVAPDGTADRRPVAGGHPDAGRVGGRRRFGRSHLLDSPSDFLPPLGNVPFQDRDFFLQLADLRLDRKSVV